MLVYFFCIYLNYLVFKKFFLAVTDILLLSCPNNKSVISLHYVPYKYGGSWQHGIVFFAFVKVSATI